MQMVGYGGALDASADDYDVAWVGTGHLERCRWTVGGVGDGSEGSCGSEE